MAITEVPGLAWMGNAYSVVRQWGGTQRRLPNCQVWLGWVMLTQFLAGGVELGGNCRIARATWLMANGVEPGGDHGIARVGLAG